MQQWQKQLNKITATDAAVALVATAAAAVAIVIVNVLKRILLCALYVFDN